MKEKKLLPLFLSQSLRSAAISLVSFFSAIYIFKRGLEIFGNQKQAFLSVFLFFLILYIFKIVANSLAEDFSSNFGLKAVIILGNFFTILTIISFFLSSGNFHILWLAAIYWGLAAGFFWFSRHVLVAKLCPEGRFGHALGTSLSLETIFSLMIPLLGGFLIAELGYQSLFLASLVIVLVSTIGFAFLKNQKTHHDINIKEILNLFRAHKKMTLAYVGTGLISSIYSEGLILFIFLSVKKELKLGIFLTFSMLLVALIDYLMCNLIDHREKKIFIAYGTILNSLAWCGRFLSNTYGLLFVFDIIGRISGGMVDYPMEIISYEKALDGGSTGRAILFREFAITLGSIIAIVLLALTILLNLPLKIVFLTAALAALSKLLILKEDGVI
jgi:MFS family permease